MAALDRAKAIKDRFGQNSGDGVIQAFAAVCRSAVRAADLVGCCCDGPATGRSVPRNTVAEPPRPSGPRPRKRLAGVRE